MNRPDPMTVTQLNNHMKAIVDNDELLNNVYVKGEISNFKRHYTGHLYFTLKDRDSLIKCVMFKTYTGYLNFEPADGMSVVILGSVSVFERDGVYQIYAKGMEQDGMGVLYAKYEQLKKQLESEGLFDDKYKKKIPMLPNNIGVITSKTGAVIRDIINVTTRRFPRVHIKLYPASVQGKGAAETIAKGIEYFNKIKNIDVIIIARGGGSLEDLWPFNEEITAMAIFKSKIPIISAVGHETDFTISDFVADLRAPTPSAAGELVVPELSKLKLQIRNNQKNLIASLNKKLEIMKNQYEGLMSRKIFKDPHTMIRDKMLLINNIEKNLIHSIKTKIKDDKTILIKAMTSVDSLSPLKTLLRGYAVVESKNSKVITSVDELKTGEMVEIIMHDGNKKAKVI